MALRIVLAERGTGRELDEEQKQASTHKIFVKVAVEGRHGWYGIREQYEFSDSFNSIDDKKTALVNFIITYSLWFFFTGYYFIKQRGFQCLIFGARFLRMAWVMRRK